MIDWPQVRADLDAQGWAILPKLLTDAQCASLAGLYALEAGFRSRIVMAPTATVAASTATSPTRCRGWLRGCAPRCIRPSRRSPMADRGSRSTFDSPRRFSIAAIGRVRRAPDAAAAPVRRGRLQLPAPGFAARRARVSAASRDAALRAGSGLYRRRVRVTNSGRACSHASRWCP